MPTIAPPAPQSWHRPRTDQRVAGRRAAPPAVPYSAPPSAPTVVVVASTDEPTTLSPRDFVGSIAGLWQIPCAVRHLHDSTYELVRVQCWNRVGRGASQRRVDLLERRHCRVMRR